MAGRGGLTFFNTSPGGAVWMSDNVPANTNISTGDATSPLVVAGTDILTIRGVFAAPMYQVNYLDSTSLVYYTDDWVTVTTNPSLAATGKLTINAQTAPDGKTLQFLADIVNPPSPPVTLPIHEALIIESANNSDVHAVVELWPGPPTTVSATQIVLAFRTRGTPLSTACATLISGGVFPSTMKSVSEVGILEEYRFYIRQNLSDPTNVGSKLTKARFMPGTNTAWGPPGDPNNAANLQIDLADNILDLQVALALDSTNHIPRASLPTGVSDNCTLTTIAADPANCYISEAANGVNDDWLYNSTTDNITAAVWTPAQLYYARLSLLARTDGRDFKYEAPVLTNIEDHAYLTTDPLNLSNTAASSTKQRMFRRRILQTVIDLRNL